MTRSTERHTLSADGAFQDRVRVYHGTLNTPVHSLDPILFTDPATHPLPVPRTAVCSSISARASRVRPSAIPRPPVRRTRREIELREGIQLRWTPIEETAEMTMDPGTAAVLQAHHNAHHPPGSRDRTLPVVEVRETRDQRSRSIIGTHLVLIRDGAVLLGKRHPRSAFAPSTWHLPAGHREDMESAVTCMVREAEEETGLRIAEHDLSLVHVLDLLVPGSTIPRVGLFFAISRGGLYTPMGWS
ncbi:NUDIX domain-containing protein [Streptomyces mirabilis]|uniref:NUDIX domain-containing protein n=1 Tax=Streptomyces mirabilis TaxID=68239 RepID=UPI003699A9BF